MAYSSDLTNEQWKVLKFFIPPPKTGGRPRTVNIRKVINAIFYVLRTGCAWDMLPSDFPKAHTVYGYFRQWKKDGTWERMHDALVIKTRKHHGRDPTPSALIIDSQSVKTTEKGGLRATTRARKQKEGNGTLLLIRLD